MNFSTKGYRTIAFNAGLAALAITDYLASNGEYIGSLFSDPKLATFTVGLIGAVNVALRFITTTPVGQREDPPKQ